VNRDKYLPKVRETAQATLASENWCSFAEEVCEWMVEQFGKDALPDIEKYLSWHDNSYCTTRVMTNTLAAFGRGGLEQCKSATLAECTADPD
jgi:hypothetical protein